MIYLLRKNGMWYAHNNCGYTARAELAEIYSKEDAEKYASHCDEIQAVPLIDIVNDADRLQEYINRLEAMQRSIRSHEDESPF